MRYSPHPPYEILSNRLMSFETIQRLRRFARYWDLIGNSDIFLERCVSFSKRMNHLTSSSSIERMALRTQWPNAWHRTGAALRAALRVSQPYQRNRTTAGRRGHVAGLCESGRREKSSFFKPFSTPSALVRINHSNRGSVASKPPSRVALEIDCDRPPRSRELRR